MLENVTATRSRAIAARSARRRTGRQISGKVVVTEPTLIIIAQEHRRYCQTRNKLSDTPELPKESTRNLPDGVSVAELNERFAKWTRFYGKDFMHAAMHALRVYEHFERIESHGLHITVRPRRDHGGYDGKYFEIVDMVPFAWADALKQGQPWSAAIEAIQRLQEQGRDRGQGSTGAAIVVWDAVCSRVIPFGSVTRRALLGQRVNEDWKQILIDDVLAGRRCARLAPRIELSALHEVVGQAQVSDLHFQTSGESQNTHVT